MYHNLGDDHNLDADEEISVFSKNADKKYEKKPFITGLTKLNVSRSWERGKGFIFTRNSSVIR